MVTHAGRHPWDCSETREPRQALFEIFRYGPARRRPRAKDRPRSLLRFS